MTDASINFQIQPSSGVPIYRQLMDQVRALVASERLRAGQLLPSIRQLATDLEVNMMTVSKAYARLEADGVLERVRGTGMRVRQVTTPGSVAERQRELAPLADAMVTRAVQLNLTEQQALAVVKNVLRERRAWLKQSSTSAS
ncbi:MAG TPA: GntR family transcriptional regulator [Pirellulales bacterium]